MVFPAAAPGAAETTRRPLTPNFVGVRVTLWTCLLAAIVLPFAYLGYSSYSDFKARETAATDMTVRTTRVAQENALKLLDIDAALQSRIADELAGFGDADIRRAEKNLHERIRRLGGDYPQVSSISVFGIDGQLLVSSRFYPVPNVSIADRADFQAARDHHAAFYISHLVRGRVLGDEVFNTSTTRYGDDGRFMGVVSVALRPSYFSSFYKELLGDGTPLGILLLHGDGTILSRYPASLGTHTDAVSLRPFLDAQGTTRSVGTINWRSSMDGQPKILAFRKVGGYDAYVSAAYPIEDLSVAWRSHLLVIAGATLVPCIALWALLIASLWRLRREEAAWNQWNQEASIRASLEAAQRESYRLETLGNLVGSVAHDFNNLLMTISVNVQIGQRRGGGALGKELDAIGRAVRGGEGLTRRLLGVARKQPLRARTLERAEWSGDFSLVKAALGDAIEFVVDIAPDAWPVHVDLSELELALINVAVNARDAMTAGGTFRIRAQNVRFPKGVMADLVGDFLTIGLEDTGVGMAPEVANRAFEPLFTTKSMGMGTGLGLAQVYSFCRQANGAVTLHSAVGEGTTVKLYLPRAAAQEEDDAPPLPADKAVDTGQRLLLVEDHRDMAEAEQALLEMLGYQVELAYDAQQALDKLAGNQRFDLVLSDVEMPGGMSGIDLAMRLRSERPGLPVILVTGYARELEKIRDQGLSVFSKPLDIDALQRHIAELLAPA